MDERELVVERMWDGQPARDDERVRMRITLASTGLDISVEAPFHGDEPPRAAPGPLWGLWDHEVVEVFVLGPGEVYTEIELGPHGHYLVLRLAARREAVACALLDAFRPQIRGPRWTASIHIPVELLPPPPHRLNAYAIHGQGDLRRFLALWAVPGAGPDFHRLECFRAIDQLPARST